MIFFFLVHLIISHHINAHHTHTCHVRVCFQEHEVFPQLPRHFRKCLGFPQLPRQFQKFLNCLGISGNAGFLQLPATYRYVPIMHHFLIELFFKRFCSFQLFIAAICWFLVVIFFVCVRRRKKRGSKSIIYQFFESDTFSGRSSQIEK
jgi:hypothetical protein